MAARNDFDDFFGDDEDAPITDTRADGRLYRVPLARLSPNLVNPRTDFGTEDQLIDFGKSLQRRQIQACPVVSRNAYLKLWPDHREQTKDVDYILVSGERRYRAADVVGLAVLDCIVNDDLAADRKTFMEAVVSENVDRQNFDPVEEAYAVQALVAEFGSNRAVAQHFERVDGWVTQRVLLTHLGREVQDLVRKKTIPLDAARSLGKLTRDNEWGSLDQLAWWEEEQARRTAAAAARKEARKAVRQQPAVQQTVPTPPAEVLAVPVEKPASFTAVKQEEGQDSPPEATPLPPEKPQERVPAGGGEVSRRDNPSPEPGGGSSSGSAVKVAEVRVPDPQVPEPRVTPALDAQAQGELERRQVKMPWHDGRACAEIAIQRATRDQRKRMMDRLMEQELTDQEEDRAAATA